MTCARHHSAGAAHPQALGKMHFDEAAVPAAQLRERVERLHHAGPLGPAASHAARQRDHGHGAGRQRVHARLAVMLGQRARGIQEIVRAGVFDAAARRKAVLRQADAAAAQVGLDLLVLHAVEPVSFQKALEALRPVGFLLLAARQQVVEQVLDHAGEFRHRAARRGEPVQLRAAHGRKQARFRAQQRGHGQRVVVGRHERTVAAKKRRLGAALVDGEIVYHRLHGERDGVLHLALGLAHDGREPLLREAPCAAG